MEQLKPIIAQAKELLLMRNDQGPGYPWLWEHAERVARTSLMLAKLPELVTEPPNETVVALAALYADVGWALQVRQGQIEPWKVLNRPTNDIQREMAILPLQEHAAGVLDEETIEMAAETIRQCGDRYSDMVEAQVLSEAENLADIGLTYVLRQFRKYQAEGRSIRELLVSWTRQREYQYWDARINDGLRFETSREVARGRLTAVDAFMDALAQELHGGDAERLLNDLGIQVTSLDVRGS